MKNYLTAGIGFSQLIRLIRKNSISFKPRYILRCLFLLQSSLWTDIFSHLENKLYGKQIENTPVPEDPIFIIGHWRTGTTLLHQLLNLDANLAAPTLFQVALPSCFLCSYHYYSPIFSTLLSKYRPMDNVRLGMNEPQEDEYAFYRITGCSPIERLVFPKNQNYFILDHSSFLPDNEKDKSIWGIQVRNYFRKLQFSNRKRIISKNPFNSFRIKELVALFPKAKFIHIIRNPYDVVPSTLNMWKIVYTQNRLNCKGMVPCLEDVTKGLDKVLTTIQKESVILNTENFYVMKFEDLESDPFEELRKLYSWFEMPFEPPFKNQLESFLINLGPYRKNEFHLSKEEKELISRQLFHHMGIFNYQ